MDADGKHGAAGGNDEQEAQIRQAVASVNARWQVSQ